MAHDEDDLDALVMACLERVEREGPAAVEKLCLEHPGQAEALRDRVRALADAGLLADPDAAPRRLGDFIIGQRLGGGGMGVVYAAVQQSLGREVALKIVRADQLYFPGARQRFRREVQIVARLAHRGIIPVYTVGEEGGVPYFAMERVTGATLAEALAMLPAPPARGAELAAAVRGVLDARGAPPVDVGGEIYAGGGMEACLRIARAVAEALAHAHERGVLHRDVKPSNVMLTADGRALLFDFGLARSRDAASLTTSGSRVGSLAYMAPEQLRGEEADVRSDVYALGALLFETLTLRPPHAGDAAAVHAALARGEPVDLRGRRPDLPRDVWTVVETALAHDPSRRYADAAAFARDLDHLLERRPIAARRVSAAERGVLWVQRHPWRAAALALVVTMPLALAVQQALAGRRVAEQRERAEANLDRALEALDGLVWGLSPGVLEHVPHLDGERLRHLEQALESMQQLAFQRPDDLHLTCQVVRLQAALGGVLLEMSQVDAAEVRYESSLALAASAGIEPAETVASLNGVGLLRERQGRLEEARKAFLLASERMGDGQELGDFLTASAILRNVSRLQRRLGAPELAREAARASVAAAERALALASDVDERFRAEFSLGAALSMQSLGGVVEIVGLRPPDAEQRAAWDRALPQLIALADRRPERSDVAHEAAMVAMNAVRFRAATEAESILQGGLRRIDRLQADYPDRVDYARTATGLSANLGLVLARQGRTDEARSWFEHAGAAAAPWLDRDDAELDFLVYAAAADVNLATSLVQLEQRPAACEPAARGGARLSRALDLAPHQRHLRVALAWARIQEGYGRIARGERERAEALAAAVPVTDLADPVIAVAVGELFAGCSDLAAEADERSRLVELAFDRLRDGLQLGFDQYDYLAGAAEWASLRGDPRFAEWLAAAAGGDAP